MQRIIVAGISTEVGKTVVCTILSYLFDADYWKPIDCGESDSSRVKQWHQRVHAPAYCLKAPLSPHHAARLENLTIEIEKIQIPQPPRPLIIEGVGGILVPLTTRLTTFDLFKSWGAEWVIVSKHYLGSINHTLLTVETLKRHGIPLLGIIFNGQPNPDSEAAILEITKLPCLGRLLPESEITETTLRRYAASWRHNF
ncbi:MAG: dethiobiotin synthase [Verrucomicrobia bacterium]|nr:dethiobiotin synthase [Verrucomicrobiota bacterium]